MAKETKKKRQDPGTGFAAAERSTGPAPKHENTLQEQTGRKEDRLGNQFGDLGRDTAKLVEEHQQTSVDQQDQHHNGVIFESGSQQVASIRAITLQMRTAEMPTRAEKSTPDNTL